MKPIPLLLLLILALAATVRFYAIDRDSLWTDEFFSMEFACGHSSVAEPLPRDRIDEHLIAPTRLSDAQSLPHVSAAVLTDTHPPLYFALLRIWMRLFGQSAAAVRSLSAVFSVVAVLMLFLTMRLLHGTPAGLWGAALVAVAAAQVEYAHEARSHAMLLAEILGCCWVTAKIEKHGAILGRCAALATLLIAAMLTHYYAAPALAAIGLYSIIQLRGQNRRRVILVFGIAAAIWCIGWGPFFWQQRHNFAANTAWLHEDAIGNPSRTFWRAIAIPARALFSSRYVITIVSLIVATIFLLPLMVIRRRRELLLWWTLLIFTVGTVAVTDLIRATSMLEMLRYTVAASAASCALIVLLLFDIDQKWQHLGPAICVIATMLLLPAAYEPVRPDYRAMSTYLGSQLQSDDALVIFEPPKFPWASDVFYLAATNYMPRLPSRLLILTRPADAASLTTIQKSHAVWIINPTGVDPAGFLPGAKVAESRSFAPLALIERVDLPR